MKLLPVALLLCSISLFAADEEIRAVSLDSLHATVYKDFSRTYLQMLRRVFKGLKEDPDTGSVVTASKKILRREGEKERTVVPAGTPFSSFQTLWVRGDSQRYLLLFWNAEGEFSDVPGGGASILAVFPEGSFDPTDVADLKTDMVCSFVEEPILSLGADDAFRVDNTHSNSNQAYLDSALFHIRGGRICLIDSVLTLSVRGLCIDSFREELVWSTEEDPGRPCAKVVATVALTRGPDEDEEKECDLPEGSTRTKVFKEVTRWDNSRKRYGPPDGRLGELDHFNQERF